MRNERTMTRYIDYVHQCIVAKELPSTFTAWMEMEHERSMIQKPFSITRWSEKLQSHFTFRLSALDQHDANTQADRMLVEFENRHATETGAGGKVLTMEEQRELARHKIEVANRAIQRMFEAQEKRLKKRQEEVTKLQEKIDRMNKSKMIAS